MSNSSDFPCHLLSYFISSSLIHLPFTTLAFLHYLLNLCLLFFVVGPRSPKWSQLHHNRLSRLAAPHLRLLPHQELPTLALWESTEWLLRLLISISKSKLSRKSWTCLKLLVEPLLFAQR